MNKLTEVSLKITKKNFNDKHSVLLGFRQTLVIVNYIFMYYIFLENRSVFIICLVFQKKKNIFKVYRVLDSPSRNSSRYSF